LVKVETIIEDGTILPRLRDVYGMFFLPSTITTAMVILIN
jgi:hypothetical protein